MVNFSVEQMRAIMEQKDNIRSLFVIGHVDHGKTTLTDCLVDKGGISKHGGSDGGQIEKDKCITIKSNGISMVFEYDSRKNKFFSWLRKERYLINLIDSPGYVDVSSEVTAALRLTDGALVVVDTVDGVCTHTEMVLHQAIEERVKPILMMNKVDRALLEFQLPAEELYQAFCFAIESVNAIVTMHNNEALGEVKVDPIKGTVAFGSGLHQWAFTLQTFAKTYGAKFGVPEEKMLSRLWGDWYFDAARKVWTTSDKEGTLERSFCQFIATPIIVLFKAIMDKQHGRVKRILGAIGVKLKGDEKKLVGKQLLKCVMQKWLPAGDNILEMIVLHLPSPAKAQSYRVDTLYEGPLDDKTAIATRTCDTSEGAPLCMYISKTVPTSDKGRFYAFGRVFSGRIATGQKVRIMGPNYQPGKKTELWIKNIQRTVIMMGRYTENVADVPAGNICALVGVDQYLLKGGTICTEDDAHTIKRMKFSVSPVIRCAVEPKKSVDLPKIVEDIKWK